MPSGSAVPNRFGLSRMGPADRRASLVLLPEFRRSAFRLFQRQGAAQTALTGGTRQTNCWSVTFGPRCLNSRRALFFPWMADRQLDQLLCASGGAFRTRRRRRLGKSNWPGQAAKRCSILLKAGRIKAFIRNLRILEERNETRESRPRV